MALRNVRVRDETTFGEELNFLELALACERLTVRELIETRVLHEVSVYNAEAPPRFSGLVQPTEAETTLNDHTAGRKILDAEKQIEAALRAFRSSGFFLLVDGRQVEDLGEQLVLTDRSEVVFIKLIPLVGG